MPRGIRKDQTRQLKNSKDPKKVARAKANRKWYEQYRRDNIAKGLTASGSVIPDMFPKAKRVKKERRKSGLPEYLYHNQIDKIGLDIGKAKKACREQINICKEAYQNHIDKYKELVALEKLMKEVTKRR